MNALTLFSTEHSRVSQARSFHLPGYLIVETKRPHRSLGTMSGVEREDLMTSLARAEEIVRTHTVAERIYILRFGEESEQVHFHIVPRTPEVLDAYLASRSDEPPCSGARIVDWLWFHQDALGYSRSDLHSWVESVRGHLDLQGLQPASWTAMADVALRYCKWVESLPLLTEEERTSREVCAEHRRRVEEARSHLLAALLAGSALEEVLPHDSDDSPVRRDEGDPETDEASPHDVDHAAWKEAYDRTAALPLGYYRHALYGADLVDDDELLIGDVSDDLADVWRDLKEGLRAWQAGEHREAAWEWRFRFGCHWGTHAVDALRQVQGWLDEDAQRPDRGNPTTIGTR